MLLQENVSLLPYNTFGIAQKAALFCTIENKEDLIQLIESGQLSKQPHLFLGGGSNVLFTQDFKGLVIKNDIKGIELIEENRNHVKIKAYSGEN